MGSTGIQAPVRVRLHGPLREAFGAEFSLHVASVGEAIRALSANFSDFAGTWRKSSHYCFLVDGKSIPLEEMNFSRTAASIDIVPSPAGAKDAQDQALAYAAAFVVIAVVSAFTFGGGLAAGGGLTNMLTVGFSNSLFAQSALMAAGAQLFVAAAIALTPDPPNESEKDASRPGSNFNGAVNTTAQGRCVPLCYGGPIAVGSHVISAAMLTEEGVIT